MHKVGDKFEVVSDCPVYGLQAGDILMFHEGISSNGAWFKTELDKLVVRVYERKTLLGLVVRPLRTEAEKRGAKFGVMGVFINPPFDMAGEFGVVTAIDDDTNIFTITYRTKRATNSDSTYRRSAGIKPYEAA